MGSTTHTAYKVNDRSYFALLKKEIHNMAVSAGLGEKRVAELDIIVAELASNLVKHAGGGELFVKLVEENNTPGIEIISLDSGPGMADSVRMVSDGVSTKNTLGLGLGSIKRLSNVFQIYSMKGWGTVVLVRVFDKDAAIVRKAAKTEIRSIVLAKPGEEACGDGFFYTITNDVIKLFLGDGLGHGAEAEEAVNVAGRAFTDCIENDPVAIIRSINTAVRKTRGLVGTVVVFDIKAKCWKLCGIGNISTKIGGPTISKNYLSYNGIIGLNVPRTLNTQEISYEKGQHIILCSDGVKSRWDLLKYTGILRYDLSVLAASLLKDYNRHTDDTSVVACKINI